MMARRVANAADATRRVRFDVLMTNKRTCLEMPRTGTVAGRHGVLATVALMAGLAIAPAAWSVQNCGPTPRPGKNDIFDYTDRRVNAPLNYHPLWHLKDIYNNHIVPLRAAMAARDRKRIMRQLVYILDRVPNDYEALYDLIRFRKMFPNEVGPNLPLAGSAGRKFPATPECYFSRGIRLNPKDAVPRMLYAMYLQEIRKDYKSALAEYRKAEALRPSWSELQYNMGLLYFDMKDYKRAREHAKRAMALGLQLPGLRQKLRSVGQWP